jgi:hypothetical protein
LNPNEVKQIPKSYIIRVANYKDKKLKFDEILSAIGDYFELFKSNTDRLEDLWI